MPDYLSKVAKEALDGCRTWPVEVVIANSVAAKDLARGIANLRVRRAGVFIKLWETVHLNLAGEPDMYSVHVEGYAAPIHVYLKDTGHNPKLSVYTFDTLCADHFYMGRSEV